mgnify:CR=1 FL=1
MRVFIIGERLKEAIKDCVEVLVPTKPLFKMQNSVVRGRLPDIFIRLTVA